MSQEIVRAEEAQRLLGSSVFQDAVQAVQDEIIRRWCVCETVEGREELYNEQKVLGRVVAALKAIIDNGRLAADRQNRNKED